MVLEMNIWMTQVYGTGVPGRMKRTVTSGERRSGSARTGRNDVPGDSAVSTTRSSPVVSLHRTAGNQAVGELHENGDLQAKSSVHLRSNEEERETERVTDAEVGMAARNTGPDGEWENQRSPPRETLGARDSDSDIFRSSASAGEMCPRCHRRFHAGKALNCEECETAVHRSTAQSTLPVSGYNEGVQPDLTISDPGDEYEREAERIAGRVVGMTDQTTTETGVVGLSGRIQRVSPQPRSQYGQDKGPACDRCGGNQQRTERPNVSPTAPAGIGQWIQSLDGGRPLSRSVRSYFEPRFGRDFGAVRVHTGPRADEAARAINADAFTHETDIVFRAGKYDVNNDEGKKLLAHELTHVVQQAGTTTVTVQRQAADPTDSGTVMEFGEDEANEIAETCPGDNQFTCCNPEGEKVPEGVSDPNKKLDLGAKLAVGKIKGTLDALKRYYYQAEDTRDVKQNLIRHFVWPSAPQMKTIMDNYEAAKAVLESPDQGPGELVCASSGEETCKEQQKNAEAWCPDGPLIKVCPHAFPDHRTGYQYTLDEILLHEAMHIGGVCGDCYVHDNCYPGTSSGFAVWNADNYVVFASEVGFFGHDPL